MCVEIWCFRPLSASTTSEVKNYHAHVITKDICNKFIELNFCVGCMVSQPNCLFQCYTTIYLINKILCDIIGHYQSVFFSLYFTYQPHNVLNSKASLTSHLPSALDINFPWLFLILPKSWKRDGTYCYIDWRGCIAMLKEILLGWGKICKKVKPVWKQYSPFLMFQWYPVKKNVWFGCWNLKNIYFTYQV